MSSGFISEVEIAAAKQKRQAEWEKVRQPDEPLEIEEEPYDARSLYERLKEQKDKKEFEFEEAHKLKNMIRGLDDDEVDFLEVIDKAKSVAERKQQQEELNELQDFRQKVASMQEKSQDDKIQAEIAKPKVTKISTRPSQKSILSGMVRKRPASNQASATVSSPSVVEKKSKVEDRPSTSPSASLSSTKVPDASASSEIPDMVVPAKDVIPTDDVLGAMKCIAILPGIGKYTESSDSEKSTDTEDEYDFSAYDWVGRKITRDKCGE